MQNRSLKNSFTHLYRRATRYYKLFKTPIKWFVFIIVLAIGYKLIPVVILSTMKAPTVEVSVETAQTDKWAEEVKSIGTIVAVQAVIIAPEVGGTVTAIQFKSGDKIESGTPIIQLNNSAEQAELARYTAQLKVANLTLGRSKKLSTKKVESLADFDQKQASAQEAHALVEQAKAIINKKNIKAPFSGILGIRKVNVGDYVQPGTPIVSLTNTNKVYLNFNLPERYSDVLKVGQKIIFTVDAYTHEEFEGVITTIDPQISETSRNISLQASANNKDDKLKSGMFSSIQVILTDSNKVITVSESAIDYGLYGSSIFIVDKNKEGDLIARKQFIKTGMHKKGRVAITQGVQDSEQIVTAGQLKLNTGARISISTDKGPTIPQVLPNS